MAKINLSTTLKNFRGDSELMSALGKADGVPQPLTMREVCVEALLSTYDDEVHLTGQEKFARYKLARVVDANDEDGLTSLTTEDIVLLKSLISKKYVPLVIGQAFEILEQTASI